MRYAVLGAAGQLGRDLCPRLGGAVTALDRTAADLTRPDTLRATLTALQPDCVLNCAAYNFVDKAETEPDAALAVNGWGAKTLAEICRDLGCTLVHFSTDYVFGLDAARQTPYSPGDAPGPVSVYGLSKLVGEYVVRATLPRHFVVRTCGLYGLWGSGGKGGNFVETMLRLAGQGKPLRIVADQICTPSFTVDVAEAVARLVKTDDYGVHHMVNADSCSWFEFARAIFDLAQVKVDLTPIASAEWKSAARRPAYSVLACAMPLRPWREALAEYLNRRTQPGPGRTTPAGLSGR